MNIVEIITKKKNNQELTELEIKYVIEEYVKENIKDYQMSALLMAIVINGLNLEETKYLTKYMLESGAKLDLSNLDNVVDKHSTGGVGDKTTLIITPLVAACGVSVAKMSGRALGYTGGTIDKLESIPNINLNLSEEEFINQIKDINVAITAQTKDIAIADKKIYALRDTSGTVESIPLIASSIMSKKIAMGAKNLVIDLKIGNGALIKNIKDGRKLANTMIEIGKDYGIKMVCILTNMDVPLGNNIGNSLEINEAIEVLRDNKEGPLKTICLVLATYMVKLGLNISLEEAGKKVVKALNENLAYNKFLELINYQKGDLEKMPFCNNYYDIHATEEGYITNLDALYIGKLAMSLGAGRLTKEDTIDYSAGVITYKQNNDYVNPGDLVMRLYTNKEVDTNIKIEVTPTKPTEEKLIFEIIES